MKQALKRKKWFKPTMLFVHRWLGLVLGIYFVVLGISGSILVYGHEIDAWLNPTLLKADISAANASLDQIVAEATKHADGLPLARIATAGDAGDTFEFCFGEWGPDAKFVYVDPATATVLGDRSLMSSFIGFTTYLHFALLMGHFGWYANGVAGWIVALLLLTGIVLWIPSSLRHLASRLWVKLGAGYKRVNYDLHNVQGIYTFPLLFVLTVTGAMFAFRAPVAFIVLKVTGSTMPQRPQPPKMDSGAAILTLEQLLNAAQAVSDEKPLRRLTLPSSKSPLMTAQFATEDESGKGHRLSVTLDGRTGSVLQRNDTHRGQLGERILNWVMPLHAGTFGGHMVKMIYVLLGLIPLGLMITGVVMWLAGLKRKRRARAMEPGELAAAAVP